MNNKNMSIFLSFGISIMSFLSCNNEQSINNKSIQSAMIPTNTQMPAITEVATLGGGCFWCTEAVYEMMNGVIKVESGYSGGTVKNPSYREVCSGMTGHAEVVQITFDPSVITYADILEIFWTAHDPTTLNRQGADVGTPYRSVIFYNSPQQKTIAEKSMKEVATLFWDDPIVTQLVPFKEFFKAEDSHQDYFALNGSQPYCQAVISPKVKKVREKFSSKIKK